VAASAGRHLAPELPQPEAARTPVSLAGKPVRTAPPSQTASGQPEQLKGVRRNMARVMAEAHANVVPTTLVDDADLHAWIGKQDITARLIRAIVAACKAVPALNAWFDGKNLTRTLHPHVDIGIAVDTDDGLFVPACATPTCSTRRHPRRDQAPAHAGGRPHDPGLGAVRPTPSA
jgi:Pyruvate/2-oxoglutarate dehydrogenase complex, dihydrolipoamide acyltransferase (E2) component, and related enzymes